MITTWNHARSDLGLIEISDLQQSENRIRLSPESYGFKEAIVISTKNCGIALILATTLVRLIAPTATMAQDSKPDTIWLQPVTPVNFLKVELSDVHATEEGVYAVLTLENPALSLYLNYQFVDSDEVLKPDTSGARLWGGRLGLVPPNGLLDRGFDLIQPSAPEIRYTVNFTDTSQRVTIRSNPLSGDSLVFNALVIVINKFGSVPASTIKEQLEFIPGAVDSILALGDDIDCFFGSPPALNELAACTASISKILHVDNYIFRELVMKLGQALELDETIIEDTLDTGLGRFGLFENIADILASLYAVARRNGNIVTEYTLTPVTLDPSLLPPWNPRLIAPKGPLDSIPTLFQWERAGGADFYNIQVSDSSEFITTLVDLILTDLEFAPLPQFLEDTTYYWRVRALNSAGTSAWSPAQFTIAPRGGIEAFEVSVGPDSQFKRVSTAYSIPGPEFARLPWLSGSYLSIYYRIGSGIARLIAIDLRTGAARQLAEYDKAEGQWLVDARYFTDRVVSPVDFSFNDSPVDFCLLNVVNDQVLDNLCTTIFLEAGRGCMPVAEGGPGCPFDFDDFGPIEYHHLQQNVNYDIPNNNGSPVAAGDRARVTCSGGSNRLRSCPTLNCSVIGQIPPCGEISVFGGPVDHDGYRWWEVEYQGTIGWTAEGDGTTYWLEPID